MHNVDLEASKSQKHGADKRARHAVIHSLKDTRQRGSRRAPVDLVDAVQIYLKVANQVKVDSSDIGLYGKRVVGHREWG